MEQTVQNVLQESKFHNIKKTVTQGLLSPPSLFHNNSFFFNLKIDNNPQGIKNNTEEQASPTKFESKSNRIINWFKDRNILPGQPSQLEDNYQKCQKKKVKDSVQLQNKMPILMKKQISEKPSLLLRRSSKLTMSVKI